MSIRMIQLAQASLMPEDLQDRFYEEYDDETYVLFSREIIPEPTDLDEEVFEWLDQQGADLTQDVLIECE